MEENTQTHHFFFDFDSTVVTLESLDEAIKLTLDDHPKKDQIVLEMEAVTNASMGGRLDFTESLSQRLELAKIPQKNFQQVAEILTQNITPGIPDIFKTIESLGHKIWIISGGFLEMIVPTAEILNIPEERCFANTVEWNNNDQLESIDLENPLTTSQGKSEIIEYLKLSGKVTGKVIMIGDGGNDLRVLQDDACDHFIGFGVNVARENVKDASPHFFVDTNEMIAFLKDNF